MTTINVKVEFSGGLELLFNNQRVHNLSLPAVIVANKPTTPSLSTKPVDLTYLIHHLRDNVLTDRSQLFMEGDIVRPGILVLVNDTDWELEGEGSYPLREGDEIVFISTLHGG
ncbi:ubiquitin-like modifier 1 [Phlebopus sp. FC_14]|nr:ubiquitin-like modifier 1 [Phlebopus sp. FC_14]